ncbi:MAG TPA: tRNA 2-thiocytidine(32) synthetase TtcA [Polyangia bacterium]|nr:tRNA 2-thiocytidine(32) synthetase TtcA [Polyangia bacterium]
MPPRNTMDVERRLLRALGKTIVDHHLIDEGDQILVALSGGKDSYSLLVLLQDLQRRAPVSFNLVAVHVDQGHPGYDGAPLERWLQTRDVPYRILHEDTYSIVTDKIPEGKTYCSLCSRLRRGVLYRAAAELGCNKIALGHHRDDTLETLLLNLFFAGKLAAMPPKLTSDDGRNVVIRPLIACAEADLAAFAVEQGFPILPCNLCGSQSEAQRRQMKTLLAELEQKHPTLRASMMAALGNVVPSHLMDAGLSRAARPIGAVDDEAEAPAPTLLPASTLLRRAT